jgi:lipooligosaccharide transport system permease protein
MSIVDIGRLPAVRSYRYWLAMYRGTWRASVISTVVTPVLYLAAMGVGLGSLVHRSSALGGVTYLQFVAPGLLAATAMQVAYGESSYPVLGSLKWARTYHAMATTPLAALDILVGHLLWIMTRVALASAVYLGVVAAFGGVHSAWGVLALPACVLIGMAFSFPIVALSASLETDHSFAAISRFVIVPMFLFSGTFFPVSQLPLVLRSVAYATPLWHGVSLVRSLTLGHVGVGAALGHVAYLVAWAIAGFVCATRVFRRKLGV